ncbi:MAG: signal peptidase I [Candidatus Berkelbacteria bacterium]|nr:signal peptidase I [Candidatus Berkelbacteria bacterium]
MSRFGPFWEILKVVAIVFVSAIIIRGFVAQPFIVEGSSMEPDFHNGEYLLIEKLGYHLHNPVRGDVIVFKYPNNPEVNYIKRIVGLPGETVRIFENQVYVNGTKLFESYLSPDEKTIVSQSPETPYEVALSNEQYFVMGDNRQHSSDSREWGPLGRDFIIGKSALVLYPRQNFSAVASPTY